MGEGLEGSCAPPVEGVTVRNPQNLCLLRLRVTRKLGQVYLLRQKDVSVMMLISLCEPLPTCSRLAPVMQHAMLNFVVSA